MALNTLGVYLLPLSMFSLPLFLTFFDCCPGIPDNVETLPVETQAFESMAVEMGKGEEPWAPLDRGYPKYFGVPIHSVSSSPNTSPQKMEDVSATAIKKEDEGKIEDTPEKTSRVKDVT